ncbi:PEP-CTERM sorting domain-containing protein [Algisphaera agarilytica]|uniref:PEP-CTERM protein-sorting domain-containing protein n=1 Tax=Algisphaera agarilytica TaxID=1385975 RepID=A0A7X0H9D2_9BACT|nr:PEP-CTERM sorting domain-containing protein [Algisphaera agarilytica]MBB6431689.1 hypothetical protein [Algisphaera agarilytica]
MLTRLLAVPALAAASLFALPTADAAPLNIPGCVAALPGTTVAAEPQLAGTVIHDEIRALNFVGDPMDPTTGYATSLQIRVVRSSLDNTLDFYYRFLNNDEFTFPLGSVDAFGFQGYDANVNYRTDGLGDTAPTTALRSVGDGDGIRFAFSAGTIVPPDLPGANNSTRFMFIDTQATEFDMNGHINVHAGLANFDPALATLMNTPRPIPEPASLAILTIGGALIGQRRHRRLD